MKRINKILQDIFYIFIIMITLFICGVIMINMDSFSNIEKCIVLPIIVVFELLLFLTCRFKIYTYKRLKIAEKWDKERNFKSGRYNPLEKVYSKEQLEQLDSAAEYSKRAEEYYDNPENYRELK